MIWLHGLGADGSDFVPVVPELCLPAELPVRFVFPHAPAIPITCNNGYVMRGWYDIAHFEQINRAPDVHGIVRSVEAVRELIQRENERGIPCSKIILAGFSQGGAVVYHSAFLRWQGPLGGLLALSTYAPTFSEDLQLDAPRRNLPVLCLHGSQDEVVPPFMGRAAYDALIAQGVAAQWREYPIGHEVVLEEIQDIAAWLQQRLPR